MPRVLRKPEADGDLLDIWVRLAMHSPAAADRVSDQLDRKFQILAEWPQLGPLREGLSDGLRMFPTDDYLIFYRPIEGGVEIIRVLHAARDIPSLF